MNSEAVLEIRDLHTSIPVRKGVIHAVNGVDMVIPKGSIVGLVGESGCGKSMTAKSIMRLLRDPAKIESGSVLWKGQELTTLPDNKYLEICGRDISMVFQEPMTSLNPVLKVGRQVREPLLIHKKTESKEEAKKQVIEMFRRVGIPEPEKRYDAYPHELSGGLRQRVMIAMAMICKPSLLIADEPTTALDVTIEAQILRLMKDFCENDGMSVLIITHNLGVVAEICDYVYVMYAGHIVESAPVFELFDHTRHPYTKGLLSSIPHIGEEQEYLHMIPGVVPNLLHLPQGCPFCNRCESAAESCRSAVPELIETSPEHFCRCVISEREAGAGSSGCEEA